MTLLTPRTFFLCYSSFSPSALLKAMFLTQHSYRSRKPRVDPEPLTLTLNLTDLCALHATVFLCFCTLLTAFSHSAEPQDGAMAFSAPFFSHSLCICTPTFLPFFSSFIQNILFHTMYSDHCFPVHIFSKLSSLLQHHEPPTPTPTLKEAIKQNHQTETTTTTKKGRRHWYTCRHTNTQYPQNPQDWKLFMQTEEQ